MGLDARMVELVTLQRVSVSALLDILGLIARVLDVSKLAVLKAPLQQLHANVMESVVAN